MFCLRTVRRDSLNGGESYEKYRNQALFDRKSGVTTGYPTLRLDVVILHSVVNVMFSFYIDMST